MIRFLLVCITVIGFLILSIPILIVEWIIGKFKPYTKDISSLRLIQAVFRFILWLTGVLYRKNRDGENTAAFKLDALSPLSLP